MLGVPGFQLVEHHVYGIFEVLVVLPDFHGVYELNEGSEILLLHRSFVVDVPNEGAVKKCFSL